MAINTPKPISRDERYLSKIGGNEEVIVPKPISREEKYMYRAAGYDDQPIPDYPIGRNEKYWAKIVENGGGSEVGSTITFDSGQKFISDNSSLKDYKIYGNGGKINPTGVLPLTFTAKAGNAVDWVIEGNDDNGTENLFNIPAKSVTSNNDYYAEVAISEADIVSYFNQHIGDTFSFAYDIITEFAGNVKKEFVIYYADSTFVTIRDVLSITITKAINKIGIRARYDNPAGNGINYTFNHFMIVAGSNVPDHYIPYQKGVGERTENEFDYSQGCDWSSSSNGLSNQKIIAQQGDVFTVTSTSALYALVRGYNANDAQISGSAWSTGGTSTYTAPANIAYVKVVFRNFEYSAITAEQKATINESMLVKGSIAPTTYIPYGYEIPISVSGKNLFATVEQGTWVATNFRKSVHSARCRSSNIIDVVAGNQYTIHWETTGDVAGTAYINFNDDAGNETGHAGWFDASTDGNATFTVPTGTTKVEVILMLSGAIACSPSDFDNLMFVKGNTAPQTYIPYFHNDYTFYIGSTPLTAGQSISKSSTGVNITTQVGENTVSTTLYNKPTMEIEASYGVGVKDNNHYIIPFKVNTTIYNIQIGDSPLYDGEYLSYKEKKLYKYIDSVLTPIDPPSPFPEISTTEGVNKVIIETSTQPDSIFITTQNPIKLVQPNIGTKTITQNGVYNASDDNLDGYSSVTVNTN